MKNAREIPRTPFGYIDPLLVGKRFCNALQSVCRGVACCDASNETATASRCPNEVLIGNAFELEALEENAPEEDWMKLVEYGQWDHPLGLQDFSRASAETMANAFNSLIGKLGRRFSGAPIYIGHPDDTRFSGRPGHEDTRAYAWVNELSARADGLYAKIKWSSAGRELLANAFYKFFSPRWAMKPTSRRGAFEPVRLISVGLTNEPNIPGEVIANEKTQTQEINMNLLMKILAKLGFADVTEDNLPSEEEVLAKLETQAKAANEVEGLKDANAELSEQLTTANERHAKAMADYQSERKARAADKVHNAVDAGILRASEMDAEITTLANAKDFDASAKALLDREPTLKVHRRSADVGARNTREHAVANEREAKKQAFTAKVSELMSSTGMDYSKAWSNAKSQHADLYAQAFPEG